MGLKKARHFLILNEEDADDKRWCAEMSASGGVSIPWTSFINYCWNNSGNFYNREPLESAIVLVPGHEDHDVPFEYCLVEMSPYSKTVVADTDPGDTVHPKYYRTSRTVPVVLRSKRSLHLEATSPELVERGRKIGLISRNTSRRLRLLSITGQNHL